MTPGTKKALHWGVLLLMLVLLGVFATHVSWSTTWASVRDASPWVLVLACFWNFLSLAAKALRWWLFLRPLGAKSPTLAIRATLAGAGINNIAMANAGEAARVVLVAKATGIPSSRVLATVAIERFFDIVGYVVMLAVATMMLPLPHVLEIWRTPAIVVAAAAGVFLVYLAVKTSHGDETAAVIATTAIPTSAVGRLKRFATRFIKSVVAVSTLPRFAGALALSLASWGLQLLTYADVARAAHAPLPLAGNVAVLLGVNIGLLIRATPGNVGVFQLLYALVAVQFGVEKDTAIAVALLLQALQVIPVTIIGVLAAPTFLRKRKIEVPAE